MRGLGFTRMHSRSDENSLFVYFLDFFFNIFWPDETSLMIATLALGLCRIALRWLIIALNHLRLALLSTRLEHLLFDLLWSGRLEFILLRILHFVASFRLYRLQVWNVSRPSSHLALNFAFVICVAQFLHFYRINGIQRCRQGLFLIRNSCYNVRGRLDF